MHSYRLIRNVWYFGEMITYSYTSDGPELAGIESAAFKLAAII